VNVRRAARHNGDGVRLCEALGTVSTPRSRAEVRLDRVRTAAGAEIFGIR
jgi:hypothetical protein